MLLVHRAARFPRAGRPFRFLGLLAPGLIAALLSCGGGSEDTGAGAAKHSGRETAPTTTPAPSPTPQPTAVELGGGLRYRVESPGGGPAAKAGDDVEVLLALRQGGDSEKPLWQGRFGFVIGSGQAIGGLDKAVRGMRPGEKRLVEIPAEQARMLGSEPLAGADPGLPVLAEVALAAIHPEIK